MKAAFGKRLLALALALCVALTLAPAGVFAETKTDVDAFVFDIGEGGVVIMLNADGTLKLTYGSPASVISVPSDREITLTGSGSASVSVNTGNDKFGPIVKLRLKNLDIETEKVAPIAIDGMTVVELTLEGSSRLKAGGIAAALKVGSSVELRISGDGSLTAIGGVYGAGIGSGIAEPCGRIKILSGRVAAVGGACAAGIGTGKGADSAGEITISGGIVSAVGGANASGDEAGAGIGGGCGSCGRSIDIYGGQVTALAGNGGAAGIGGGTGGDAGVITITDGCVKAVGRGGGTGIGYGLGGGSGSQASCGIEINGGFILAEGGSAPAIDAGTATDVYTEIKPQNYQTRVRIGTEYAGGVIGYDEIAAGPIEINATYKYEQAEHFAMIWPASGGVQSFSLGSGSSALAPGDTYQFIAEVRTAVGTSNAVYWLLDGAESTGTYIDLDGKLTIGADETASKLTVTAAPAVNGSYMVESTVTLQKLTLTPEQTAVAPGGSYTFSAGLTGLTGETAWSVEGAKSGSTSIAGGVLSVGADETAGVLTVTARAVENEAVCGSALVAVGHFVDVSSGDVSIVKSETAGFLKVTYGPAAAQSVLEIPASDTIALTGATTKYAVVVSGVDAALALIGADIQPESGRSALSLANAASVALRLCGENALSSGGKYAGIEVPLGASLNIFGSGSLRAAGGGAGIGASDTASGLGLGDVTVSGGTVIASGGAGSAGIGGSGNSSGGSVTVSGGSVSACGGLAGIGGRQCSVKITGGAVCARGGTGAVGIGGEGSATVISGGRVTAVGGTDAPAMGVVSGGSASVKIAPAAGTSIRAKAGPAANDLLNLAMNPYRAETSYTSDHRYAELFTLEVLGTPASAGWVEGALYTGSWGAVENAANYQYLIRYPSGMIFAAAFTEDNFCDFSQCLASPYSFDFYYEVYAYSDGINYDYGGSAKSDTIHYTAPTLAFTTQPQGATVHQGSITGSLTAAVSVSPAGSSGAANLEWFECSAEGSTSGDSLGSGGSFEIPTGLTAGTHYFICKATYYDRIYASSSAAAVTVTEPVYEVALPSGAGFTAAAAEGSASPVLSGGSFSFTVRLAYGYRKGAAFAVTANGVPLTEANGVYTIADIDAAQSVAVTGAEAYIRQVDVNGSYAFVSGAGDYEIGGKVFLNAGTREHYRFGGWKISGASVSDSASAAVSFTMPDNNVTATASWIYEPVSFVITASASAGGAISPSGDTAVEEGQSFSFTLTADDGYALSELLVDGESAAELLTGSTYTFENVSAPHTISAAFELINSNPFSDVTPKDWFYDDVMFVFGEGLMFGTGNGRFSPKLNASRATVAVTLWRAAGCPEPKGSSPFADVPDSLSFADAVVWAAENEIFFGCGDGLFHPNDNITREQLAAVFCRYANFKGFVMAERGDLSSFSDAESVSRWAKDDMSAAVGAGLIRGKENGRLDPLGTATRAELAALLRRLVSLV